MKEKIPGVWKVAQRMINAENNFVQMIMEKGFSRDEATRAMRTMLRLKVAKLDPVIGRILVKHGGYLDSDAIRRAIDYRPIRKKNPGPTRHTVKFDRCVQSVKKRLKGVSNPYAVCMAALGKKALRKKPRKR